MSGLPASTAERAGARERDGVPRAPTGSSGVGASTARLGRRLLNRDFLLVWQGQSVSLVGTQIFTIALMLWVKAATGSATLMGTILMVSSLPGVFLGPFAGALADRWHRKWILVVCDASRALAVLALALLFARAPSTEVALAAIFGVSFLLAIGGSFFQPALSAAIPDLVDSDDLPRGNSLIMTSAQVAVFIGQGLGGVLFRLLGAPVLFLLNGLSYGVAAAMERYARIPGVRTAAASRPIRARYREILETVRAGFRYILGRSGLKQLVTAAAIQNFFMMPVIVLLPFYVEDVLGVGAAWYGYLLAFYGVGTLTGALVGGALKLAGRARAAGMLTGMAAQACGILVLGLTGGLGTAVAVAFGSGAGVGVVQVYLTTVLQSTTPPALRGRVFGVLATLVGATAPVAMGLAGVVADLLDQDIPRIFVGSGAVLLAVVVSLALMPDVRSYMGQAPTFEEPWRAEPRVASPTVPESTPAEPR